MATSNLEPLLYLYRTSTYLGTSTEPLLNLYRTSTSTSQSTVNIFVPKTAIEITVKIVRFVSPNSCYLYFMIFPSSATYIWHFENSSNTAANFLGENKENTLHFLLLVFKWPLLETKIFIVHCTALLYLLHHVSLVYLADLIIYLT